MANFVKTDGRIGLSDIETNETTKRDVALGYTTYAEHATRGAGAFKYLKGVASTAVGSWVLYSESDYTTSLLAANDIGQVAIAMSACVAGEFGWYQTAGKASGKALSGYADNAEAYATGTAGSVDDAVVAGDRVKRTKGASAVSGGLADFEIQTPYMDNGLAA